jgi:hypothetical protein
MGSDKAGGWLCMCCRGRIPSGCIIGSYVGLLSFLLGITDEGVLDATAFYSC